MSANYTAALLYTVVIVAAFYFVWFRPQQRQRKAMVDLMASLAPGDEVMTAGGMVGTVIEVTDDVVRIEIASGVVVRFAKGAVVSRRQPGKGSTDA